VIRSAKQLLYSINHATRINKKAYYTILQWLSPCAEIVPVNRAAEIRTRLG
jgi:hypothetical protein